MPPDPRENPRVTSDSLKREFQRLRGAVSEYPALEPIVERIPDDVPEPGPTREQETDSDAPTNLVEPPRTEAQLTTAGGASESVGYVPTLDLNDWDSTKMAPRPMRLEDKKQALDARQQIFQNRAVELNAQLKNGRIEPDEWMRRMMGQVKDMHTTAYAIGYSGRWEQISQRDWGAVGATVQRQYQFLRRWRAQIEQDGIDSVSLAKLNDRAQKYGAAASESFEKGYSAEVGMPPNILPAYPGDGTTECMTRCKCRWAINILDKQNQDFDCTWTLGVAEHCETCLERASSWVQLEVRNGVLASDPEPIFAR